VYAAGVKYLFMAVIFLALGIPVFMWARKEKRDNLPVFTAQEKMLVFLLLVFALGAVYTFCHGHVSL
jgi:arginine:ornithine antiporter/lysine permease